MVRIDCFAYIYCYYIRALYSSLSEDGESKTVTFITREGPFLKRLFEFYQNTLPAGALRHETDYVECSRNAVLSTCKEDLEVIKPIVDRKRYFHAAGLTVKEIERVLTMDECEQNSFLDLISVQSESSLQKYLSSHFEKKVINIADFGGRGYIQDKLSKHYGLQTEGYYLSFRAAGGVSSKHKRALVYIASEQLGKFSKYCHIFISVNYLLEELAMNGEGPVLRFAFDKDGAPIRIKEWDEERRRFYDKWISKLQPEVELLTRRLMRDMRLSSPSRLLRKCAWSALWFAVLKNKDELEFVRDFVNVDDTVLPGYNIEACQRKINKNSCLGVFFAPDEFVHSFNKLQNLMWCRWWSRPVYFCISVLFGIYTWTVVSAKYLLR